MNLILLKIQVLAYGYRGYREMFGCLAIWQSVIGEIM